MIVSMSILIPEFTTLQETVSNYFNKRDSRGLRLQSRLVSEFVRRRRGVAALLTTVLDQYSLPNSSSYILTLFSVRQGLKLVQGEWNILKMGNPKYIGQCKLVRFKTIYIESVDTQASIPLMTDGIINVSLIFSIGRVNNYWISLIIYF